MVKRLKEETKPIERERVPLDPDAREAQMIAAATNLAYQQLMDGTASSQVITHYLKLGTQRERIEKEILEKQKDLIIAKTEAIQSAKRIEELYTEAIGAMKRYSGNSEEGDSFD